MTFAPDHESDLYSDGVRMELFDQVRHSCPALFCFQVIVLFHLSRQISKYCWYSICSLVWGCFWFLFLLFYIFSVVYIILFYFSEKHDLI